MHQTSYDIVKNFTEKHVPGVTAGQKVLDVGATHNMWNYGNIFTDLSMIYKNLDMSQGADYIVPESFPYDWNVLPRGEQFDVVVSGQSLEHDKFFWKTLQNIATVTKPGGIIIIVVPSRGPVHRFPVDCYRFYPDSQIGFGEIMNAEPIDMLWDPETEWGDLGMAFKKR
jgi:SAM-dependent methyltransferase